MGARVRAERKQLRRDLRVLRERYATVTDTLIGLQERMQDAVPRDAFDEVRGTLDEAVDVIAAHESTIGRLEAENAKLRRRLDRRDVEQAGEVA